MGASSRKRQGPHRSNRNRRPTRYDAAMAAIGRVDGVVIDGADTMALARFWAALFDTEIAAISNEGGDNEAQYVDVAGTADAPLLRFQRVPEAKAVKNRLHLDIEVTALDELGERVGCPVIKGETRVKERQRLFQAFRSGEIDRLVVSKVANFSIDLPEASVAVQVSGTFGSRQEEAQRLGRLLRPKGDGRQAHFYSVVSRDTLDTDYAAHRQRFLAEQGYSYTIVDADDLLTA